ncbi:MAG: hypothetical protein CMI31_15150 [Opitutae bacterium]|nr:hypothetical protein [Opitutae bacterium]
MDNLQLTVLLFASGFALSVVPRIILIIANRNWFKQGFMGDSSIHWVLVKTIKGNRNFDLIPQYLIGQEPSSYPRSFHHFAALFPIELLKRNSWLPNLVLFGFFGGAFAVCAWNFASLENLPNFQTTLLSSALFVFSLSNLTADGPAIAYLKLSERLYARLFGGAYFAAMAIGIDFDNEYSLIISAVSGAIAGTASTFGRQAIWFVTPLVSLVLLDWTPLVLMFVATFGSILLSGKQLFRGVKYTILLWKTYSSHTKKSKVQNEVLSKFMDFRLLFGLGQKWKRKMHHLLFREPTRAFFRYPELVLFFFAWICFEHPSSSATFAIVVSSVLVYFLTSTRVLNHLGESYRYLEYNLLFLLPLFLTEVAFREGWMMSCTYGLLAYSLIVAILVDRFLKNKKLAGEDSLQIFLEQTNIGADSVVFPVSMRLGADICARSTCKSFWWQPGNVTREIFDYFIEEYPYLKKNWKPLASEFGVTHVVADKHEQSLIDWGYDFSELSIISENERFLAYEVPRSVLR